ncbi:MAG: 50S ribosomal protein L23 [Clostridia bacterium]|nr:50S ribosomal protein L23 [Clostridia bacterium]
MKFAQDIILKPVVTEHSMDIMRSQRKYTFVVAQDANKIEIKKAVEEIFKVKVSDVNTMHLSGKNRRRGLTSGKTAKAKRAIVTLTEDSKTIEFFDSLM